MIELRGRLLQSGALVPGALWIERGRIARVDALPDGAARAGEELPLVAPGLIDLHVHGYGGCDPLEDLAGMARALAQSGTTAFQPTLFPSDAAALGHSAERVARAARDLGADAARAVGIHLEGPFVNPRAAGALPVSALAEPSRSALAEILGPDGAENRGVRTVTLAPELPGAADLIGELARRGLRASLGHSLATAAEARRAAARGACGATHLFNAMPAFHHREAGLAGFALADDALFAEIIGDLAHVGREAFALALAARGPLGLCLVSDALRVAGTGCDVFEAGGHRHRVRDGAVYFADGGAEPARLAGSATGQLAAVRRLVAAGVCSLEDALTMASEAPARALGLERELGRIAAGARADLLVLDPVTLALRRVLLGGEPIAERGSA